MTLGEARRAEERAFAQLAKVKDGRDCAGVIDQCARHAQAARETRVRLEGAAAAARRRFAAGG